MPNHLSKNHLLDMDEKQPFKKILTDAGHCLWKLNKKGYLIEFTDNLSTLLGYSLKKMLAEPFIEFIVKEERENFLVYFNNHQEFLGYPIKFLHKEERPIIFSISAEAIFNKDKFCGYFGVGINITDYQLTEEKLRLSENNLAIAQKISNLGSWEVNLITNELFWSDEIYRLLGKKLHSQKPSYDEFIKVIHPDDLEMVMRNIAMAMLHKTYDIQHRIIQENGKIGILHERGEVVFDDEGNPVRMFGTAQNVTKLREAEQKIMQLENYDFLTDLSNRSMFSKQTKNLLTIAKQNKQSCGLFCMGLDRFKFVNESMGYDVGNELLKAVADRLSLYQEEGEIISRLGGDEFALIKVNLFHEKVAAEFAKKIIKDFATPFLILGEEIIISLSIGITFCFVDNRSIEDLLKDAQTAMYNAKASEGNCYQFYSWEMTHKVKKRLNLESDLRHALENKEFRLYYQAKVSTKTGKISGAEALIRWEHPKKGLISPDDFVSVLEDTGLIVPVGEWSLQEICQQYNVWYDMGLGDLSLALNLSVKQFIDGELCKKVKNTLDSIAHNSDFLELEVTESLLMQDLTNSTAVLKKLHALGIKLSIDDFGTGYSSLAYLKLMPVDTLKIDRSFVIGLPYDKKDNAIVEVIINLAKALDLSIIAEGVETKPQLDFLVGKKCDYIQGYYYSKPLPKEEFTALLLKDRMPSRQLT